MGERLLVVVAHPDDETFGTGSLIAHAAERGVEVVIACATRGEAGEPVPGTVPAGRTLAEVREVELHEAATFLGASQVVVFDWVDSGMGGDPAEGTLCAAPLHDVAVAIARVLDDVAPSVVVTLDGSDGHRDHIHVRDATLIALDLAARRPARVYFHCLPQALMRRWVEELEARQPDAAHLGLGDLGTADDDITTVLDTSDLLDRREAAMRIHASQTPPFDVMPDDLRREFLTVDCLRRVVPPWSGGEFERELFAPR